MESSPASGATEADSPSFDRVLPDGIEEIAQGLLPRMFVRIGEVWDKLDGPYMNVETHSSLRLDDRYLGRWRGGSLHRSAMVASGDALLALRATLETVLAGEGALPMVALFPVIRTAIECASLAIYLLAPIQRDERLRRSYYIAREDASRQDSFGKVLRGVSGTASSRVMGEIRELIATRPTLGDPTAFTFRAVKYSDLIAGADVALAADPASRRTGQTPLLAWWQWLSGMSHGKMWAFITGHERRDAIIDEANESANVKQTASLASVALSLQGGIEALEAALRLYGQRSKTAWAQPEDATEPPVQTWKEMHG